MIKLTYTAFLSKHLDEAAQLEQYAPDPWTRRQLESELNTNAAQMFAAVDESGRLCGFCAFQQAAGEANLNAVTVLPEMRGKGIAAELLRHAFSRLDANEIYLEVRSRNESAIALYKKLCFTECGLRRGFYKSPDDDAIIMKLNLS